MSDWTKAYRERRMRAHRASLRKGLSPVWIAVILGAIVLASAIVGWR